MQRRAFLVAAPAVVLVACGPAEPMASSASVLSQRAYRHPGPPMLSLFTMKSTSSDNGMHTGLMINASQRVIFDPAGTFGDDIAREPWGYLVPENNDVHYGITDEIAEFYARYHARITYYVLRQDLVVTPAQAEAAFRAATAYGAVPKAQCTVATTAVLRQVPGFQSLQSTWFPDNLSRQFASFPGVVEREYRENDSDDKSLAADAFGAQIVAAGAVAQP